MYYYFKLFSFFPLLILTLTPIAYLTVGDALTSTLPMPSYINGNSCVVISLDLNIALPYNYVNINYVPQRFSNQVIFSDLRVNESLPNSCSVRQLKNFNNMSDINGFVTNRNQFLSLEKNRFNSPIIYITINFDLTNVLNNNQLQFDIAIDTSDQIFCPNDCNNNGLCKSDGQCQCNGKFIGYDCSILPYQLNVGGIQKFNITPSNYVYLIIPPSTMVSNLNLYIKQDTISNYIMVFYGLNGSNQYGKVINFYQNSYFYLNSTNQNISVTLAQYVNTFQILIWNFDVFTVRMEANLTIQSSVNYLMIIMIVIGSAILIALIISIIYIVRKKRSQRIVPHQMVIRTNIRQLSTQEIQTYFPIVMYQSIMNCNKNESSLDMIPTQDCVICLCQLDFSSQVRVTYCNHIFHKQCLTSWFQKQQNCPYCRQSFQRQQLIILFEKIYKHYQNKYPNKNPNLLRGMNLVIQIIDFHKTKVYQKQKVTEPQQNNTCTIQNF